MKVFKYLTPERVDVLKDRYIRFTQAIYLNDPFESLPFISKLMSDFESSAFYGKSINPILNEIENRKLSINDIPEEFREKIPQEVLNYITSLTIKDGLELLPEIHPAKITKLLLSSSAEDLKINISAKIKQSWNKIFGILSLSQINNNITMWSHYAKNHEGYVIEFDPENEFFNKKKNINDPFGFLRSVNYSNKRPVLELVNFSKPDNEFIESIAQQILYTKSEDWANEKELRLICNLSEFDKKISIEGQEIYLFSFPPIAIKAIYIGVNASISTIETIENILKNDGYEHVNILHGELDLKEFKIIFN